MTSLQGFFEKLNQPNPVLEPYTEEMSAEDDKLLKGVIVDNPDSSTLMAEEKRQRLENSGWTVGSTDDFLNS